MTPSDPSSGNKRSGEQGAALTGVDRLFGRDLRRGGWFFKSATGIESTAARAAEMDTTSDAELDPAMIWALRWRRK